VALLPSTPARQTSFTDYSTNYPGQQQPGDKLDAEFDRTNAVLGLLLAFVATLFQSDGRLKPSTVSPAALTPDLTAQLADLNAARAIIANQSSLKWAEYLAGPVIAPADAPAAIALTNIPSGLFYDPVQGGPGGLFSAKYWALQAMSAVAQFEALYGAPNPPPLVQIVPLTPWDFTNTDTEFPLTRRDDGTAIEPAQSALLVSLNGYVQTPGVDFTVAGSTITFAQPPLANEPHYAVWLSPQAPTSTATGNLDGGSF
jgi:hypothetical protein